MRSDQVQCYKFGRLPDCSGLAPASVDVKAINPATIPTGVVIANRIESVGVSQVSLQGSWSWRDKDDDARDSVMEKDDERDRVGCEGG